MELRVGFEPLIFRDGKRGAGVGVLFLFLFCLSGR